MTETKTHKIAGASVSLETFRPDGKLIALCGEELKVGRGGRLEEADLGTRGVTCERCRKIISSMKKHDEEDNGRD